MPVVATTVGDDPFGDEQPARAALNIITAKRVERMAVEVPC
jgi:hypothetical protein